jgi:hypothetical protein
VEACQQYGLTEQGNKEQLVAALHGHFANSDVAQPAALPESLRDEKALSEHELDLAIQSRTEELHALHQGDGWVFLCAHITKSSISVFIHTASVMRGRTLAADLHAACLQSRDEWFGYRAV